MSASTVSARYRRALIDAGIRPRRVATKLLPASDCWHTMILVHENRDLQLAADALAAAFPGRDLGVSIGGYVYAYTPYGE